MARKSGTSTLDHVSLKELRRELKRREEPTRNRAARLRRRRDTLLRRIEKIDRELDELRREIGRKPGRPRGRKKGKAGRPRTSSRKLGKGTFKDTVTQVVRAAQGPVTARDIMEGIKAKGIYKKIPPYLFNMIYVALKRPEFKKVGKGKYTLSGEKPPAASTSRKKPAGKKRARRTPVKKKVKKPAGKKRAKKK